MSIPYDGIINSSKEPIFSSRDGYSTCTTTMEEIIIDKEIVTQQGNNVINGPLHHRNDSLSIKESLRTGKFEDNHKNSSNDPSPNDGNCSYLGRNECEFQKEHSVHLPSEEQSSSEQWSNNIDYEEWQHFETVLGALAYYQRASELQWKRLEHHLNSIPSEHHAWLDASNHSISESLFGSYMSPHERISHLRAAANSNAKLINNIIAQNCTFLNQTVKLKTTRSYVKSDTSPPTSATSIFNAEKVQATMHQLVREWSHEGKVERDQCFLPILGELKQRLPVKNDHPFEYRVFCPGSGLGRLPLEICLAGYESLANEYSYFMLIISNFILNQTNEIEEHTIYPWIHQVNNVLNSIDQLKPTRVPDINPNQIPPNSKFGCVAGDFLEIGSNESNSWDAVCTCFFIDTANNVMEFIHTIYKILKPGGIWINLGPLLYHYSEMADELSLELTLDQIIHVTKQIGFSIEGERLIECHYTRNAGSMMHVVYTCPFFVGIKPKQDDHKDHL